MIFPARDGIPGRTGARYVVLNQYRILFDKRRLGGRWSACRPIGSVSSNNVQPGVRDLGCCCDAECGEAEATRVNILDAPHRGVRAVGVADVCGRERVGKSSEGPSGLSVGRRLRTAFHVARFVAFFKDFTAVFLGEDAWLVGHHARTEEVAAAVESVFSSPALVFPDAGALCAVRLGGTLDSLFASLVFVAPWTRLEELEFLVGGRTVGVGCRVPVPAHEGGKIQKRDTKLLSCTRPGLHGQVHDKTRQETHDSPWTVHGHVHDNVKKRHLWGNPGAHPHMSPNRAESVS